MKISIGTEAILGLRKLKTDAPPTTAYLMLGSRCSNNCLFCPQARRSTSNANLLSRVVWNNVQTNIWPIVQKAYKKDKIQRACIQVVNQPGIFNTIVQEVKKAGEAVDIPLCISGGINSLDDAETLMSMGVDRITIALDAVTPPVYRRVKGTDFLKKLTLLEDCARKYPGKVSTHLIAGLGETEEEIAQMIQSMYEKGIRVALFAFTPVKGTPLENLPQPPVGSYRRIQIVHYLIREKICSCEDIIFKNGRIAGIKLPAERLREILADGRAFLTSGCPGCNRPYYNEKPGSTIYNYPRDMTEEEIEKAVKESGIVLG